MAEDLVKVLLPSLVSVVMVVMVCEVVVVEVEKEIMGAVGRG